VATAYKVLGQAAPSAGTDTPVYTVPAATQAVVSTIFVSSTGSATTIRIRVAVAGAASAAKQWLFFDSPIGPNQTIAITSGITLGAGDVIAASSALGSCSFSVFGQEIT